MSDKKEFTPGISGLADDSENVEIRWVEEAEPAVFDEISEAHLQLLEECQSWIAANTDEDAVPEMVWVDVETTGLDFDSDLFLELGIIVTNAHGKIVKNGIFQSIIHVPGGVDWETRANEFVRNMHTKSRLAREIEISHAETQNIGRVEQRAIQFLENIFGADVASLKLPISGSSVGFDKRWLEGRMPVLASIFGHRVIDVSSLRLVDELLSVDGGARPKNWRGYTAHRVIPDIIDTIGEYLLFTGQAE